MARQRDENDNRIVGARGGSTERSDNREADIRHNGMDLHSREADPSKDDPTTEEQGYLKDEDPGPQEQFPSFMLRRATTAYLESTDYMDSSLRKIWQDNLHHFRSEHSSGSRYYTSDYNNRNKLFRPKQRASVRNHEASFAAAAFSTNDVVSVSPQNPNDTFSWAGAKIGQQLLQYRLDYTIPWYTTALAAYQDTHVYGVCISRQEWKYEVYDEMEYDLAFEEDGSVKRDDDGNMLGYERPQKRVINDKPIVDLIAPENFRFDPNSDFRNPIESSPYLIEQIPMFAIDVREMMAENDPKTGKPKWKKYTLEQIRSAGQHASATDQDTTRKAREGRRRQDPVDTHPGSDYEIIWVHFNIMKYRGIDYAFWTLATTLLLTDPVPLLDIYPLGRPYRVGFSTIEAHRNFPAGTIELAAPLQEGINLITNQRSENVALALNKRYFIKRQKIGALDLQALMRNVPGGGVMVDDPDDVKVIETRDVTASSYTEQDRLAVEMDELTGNFSQSSVQSNKALNDTVGGMNLLSSGANQVQEYTIRTFMESWYEPVLAEILKLEMYYETDQTILALAGEKAGLFQQYGIDEITDELLDQHLVLRVNVGMGNTNPAQKMEKLNLALSTVMSLPELASRLNTEEIGKEVFGYAGFADGERFLLPMDEVKPPPEDPMIALKKQELELKSQDSQSKREENMARLELQREESTARLQLERELAYARLALDENKTMAEMEQKLGIETMKDQSNRDMVALREGNKSRELAIVETGGEGVTGVQA